MRAVPLFSLAFIAAVSAFFGCSATGGSSGFTQSGSGGSGSGTGAGGGDVGGANFSGTGTGTGGSSASGGADCSDAAKLIYVLTDGNDLYSFQPQQKKFSLVGHLGCNTPMQPNSMAIDRDAVAWVNYVESDPLAGMDTGGAVFKVSTSDASCQPTNIQLPQGWYRMGMGYSSDTVDGKTEKLFVTGTESIPGLGDSPGLGQIDFSSNTVKPIGQFTKGLAGKSAELTGTGDAKLFGFFTTTPVKVAELDKGTGAVVTVKALPNVETPAAWAFSFWGGDFYLYTAPDPALDMSRTTDVTVYHPADGSSSLYMHNIGFRIVGAGVSTCAPISTPK
jgi:hypothetical protein